MTLPLVTIGIPTYNRADGTLLPALRSALAQTHPNLEVVVSDNCSTDGTRRLLESMDDPRLRYVRQEHNLGLNGNFNACLDEARGEYLLLLHDDDLVDPDLVEACVAALPADRPVGLVRTGVRIIDGDGHTVLSLPNLSRGTTVQEFVQDWFDKKTSPYCCNTLMNVAALRAAGGYRSRHNLFNDVLAQVKVAASHGCANVHEVKASWRRHGSNTGSAALIRNWCEDSLELLETIAELVPDADVQARGKPFLCRMNYGYAAELRSPWRRLRGYLTAARLFDHSHPVVPYAYAREIRPVLRGLKRRVTGAAPPAPPPPSR